MPTSRPARPPALSAAHCAGQSEKPAEATDPANPSPSRATTTTSSSTSTATPGCAATWHAPGRAARSAPTASNTNAQRPERQAHRAASNTPIPCSWSAATAATTRRRWARASRAPSSNCRSAARAAPPATCTSTARARSRSKASPSPPAPPNQVDWQLQAKQIELDTQARNGTGRGTKVEFKGVPMLYLPWLTFPIGPQRKSGFLFPEPRRSSRNGAELEVPYYWNIRPNLDFTAQPVYYSKRGLDLAGELRYLTHRQRGTFEFNYLPDDDIADRDRSRFTLNARRRAAGRMALPHRCHRRQRHRLLRGFRARPGRHQRAVRRTAGRGHLPRRAPQRARAVPGFPDHRRRTRRGRPALCAHAAPAGVGRLEITGLGAIDYGFDAEMVNFDRDTGCHRLAPRRRAARGLRLVGAGILRAPLGGLSLHAVLARGPGAGHRRFADALAAVRDARRRPGVRTQLRLAGTAAPDARTARPVPLHAVSRAEPAAAVRHRAARPEPRAAVSHQPLRRRGSRQRRQPDRRRPHQPPARLANPARNTWR